MDLHPDPSLPPSGSSSSCKELIHWYFLFLLTSRILHGMDGFSPGRSRVVVHIATPVCGGTVLLLPIFPVVQTLFIFAAFAALAVERCTV